MSQGLLPYTVETVPDLEGLTSRAGLPLVLETMRALGLDQAIAQHVHVRERQSGYTEAEKLEALVLLLAAGGDCLDDIAVLQADGGLGRLLKRQLPSADTLRHFLYACHDDQLITTAQAQRPAGQVAYIPAEKAALQGLAHVNTALVHRVAAQGKSTTATLDHDATIQESHKREALSHYKGGRGSQPTAVVWVEQDLVVADEYRDGNVGAGMATLPRIQRAFASLPATVTTFAFRADTACYDEPTLQWLADPARPGGPAGPLGVPIGADMTQDLPAGCAAVADGRWQCFEDRPDETVHCTEVEFTPGTWTKDAQPLRYVALRIRKKQGQLFASGADTKVPGAREQSLGRARRRSAPLALAEGGDDRARARQHQERARRRCAAVWALRGQRGLVPAEPPHLQRPQRAEGPGPAPDVEHGPAEAPPLHALHAGRPPDHARGATGAPGGRRRGAPCRLDRRARPARPGRPGPPGRISPALTRPRLPSPAPLPQSTVLAVVRLARAPARRRGPPRASAAPRAPRVGGAGGPGARTPGGRVASHPLGQVCYP